MLTMRNTGNVAKPIKPQPKRVRLRLMSPINRYISYINKLSLASLNVSRTKALPNPVHYHWNKGGLSGPPVSPFGMYFIQIDHTSLSNGLTTIH